MAPSRFTAILALSVISLLAHRLQADPAEDRVGEIRALYNTIEGAKLDSTRVEVDLEGDPVFASCTRYLKGGEVVKVHLAYAGEHSAVDHYFYYDGGTLFFVHAKEGSWRFAGRTRSDGTTETLDSTVEHRVYLQGDQVVRHLRKEASAPAPEELNTRLAQAENKTVAEPERAARLLREGTRARTVRTAKDLRLLLESD